MLAKRFACFKNSRNWGEALVSKQIYPSSGWTAVHSKTAILLLGHCFVVAAIVCWFLCFVLVYVQYSYLLLLLFVIIMLRKREKAHPEVIKLFHAQLS